VTLAYGALALTLAITAGALLSRLLVTPPRTRRPAIPAEDHDRVTAERDAARKQVETLRFDLRRVTAEYTRLHDSTEALAEDRDAVRADRERLAKELAAEKRRGDRLQERLDDAVGLNSPAVDAGRHWQQNRPDAARKAAKEGGAR
jgi:DNA repair exonuclease SbcCD ATPase subunit